MGMPMSEFVRLVVDMFMEAVGVALIAMIFGTIAWVVVRDAILHREEQISLKKILPVMLFTAYLGGLVTVTLLIRTTGNLTVQWHLFLGFREAWNHFSLQHWLNIFLNIGMFAPMGFLLPFLGKVFRRWYVTLPVCFGVSLLIEIVQFLAQRGAADVDDLFCNTLGAALGYCVCMTIRSLAEKAPRKSAAYGWLPLLTVVVFAGVFLSYYTQPYGNLPDGPTITVDTGGLDWILECELSDREETLAIYGADPYDGEEAIRFAEEFLARMGCELSEMENYDDLFYFTKRVGEGSYTLWVNRLDRSYRYGTGRLKKDDQARFPEAWVREALGEIGIEVPQGADFYYVREGGAHCFSVENAVVGDEMVDGVLRCWFTEDGEISSITNYMGNYELRGTQRVISQAQAYQRLRQGRFSDGVRMERLIERNHLTQIRVTACTLTYVVDTKGYRQPVYEFALEGLDSVYVPALAG